MFRQQKQIIETFVRVQGFTDSHPLTTPFSYGGADATIGDVVRRLREHAGAQVAGRALSREQAGRQRQVLRQLLDEHVRPIVAIARAQDELQSDVRMPSTIRMPRNGIGVTKVLQFCDGIIEAARPFESTFLAFGRPADFLARFTAARDALEALLGGRAAHVETHVAARAGLAVQIRRGRSAVRRIDSVVRAAFRDDAMTLAVWRAAKRVHLPTGRSSARGEGEDGSGVTLEQLPQAA